MRLAWSQTDGILEGINRLDANKGFVGIILQIGNLGTCFFPGVPYSCCPAARLVNADSPPENIVYQNHRGFRIVIMTGYSFTDFQFFFFLNGISWYKLVVIFRSLQSFNRKVSDE